MMEEREARYRQLQEKEAAIARQIKQQSNEFQAQSSAWVQVRRRSTVAGAQLSCCSVTSACQRAPNLLTQAQMEAEEAKRLRRKGILPGMQKYMAAGDSDSDDGSDASDSEDDSSDDEELVPLELELNPAHRGTQLQVATSLWFNISTLQVHEAWLGHWASLLCACV